MALAHNNTTPSSTTTNSSIHTHTNFYRDIYICTLPCSLSCVLPIFNLQFRIPFSKGAYGKTWLMGKVTAIDGVKVTLMGTVDNTAHSFVADENTTFRKRRDPITLADIQVGDMVRVEGAVKGGSFVAAAVNAMGPPQGGNPSVPRNGPPPPQ